MTQEKNPERNFESSFARLEEILEQMNSGNISLDEALKSYEEADKLISFCNKLLSDAEKKIETLMKSRNGELVIGSDQKPLTQEMTPSNQANLPKSKGTP